MNLIVPQVKLFAHSSHSIFYSLAAVYVCSFCLVEHLRDSLRAPNLYSEWGCWLLLATLAQLVKYSRGKRAFENKHQSDRLPLALVALVLCWNFGDVKWAVPLLTPACFLIVTTVKGSINLPISSSEKHEDLPQSAFFKIHLPTHGFASSAVIAIISAASLLTYPPTGIRIGTGLVYVACASFVFLVISQGRANASPEDGITEIPIPGWSTAWPVLAVLTLMILIPSQQHIQVNLTLVGVMAALSAVQWITLLEMINRGHLLPLSTILIFATSALQLTEASTPNRKCNLLAAVALVGLAQTYRFIHKLTYSRHVLLGCGILVFGLVAHHNHLYNFSWPRLGLASDEMHPIEILVQEANAEFQALISSQSRTLEAAVAEYEKRYHRVPPPGFDTWFRLAIEANSPIIDNFDTVMNTLDPFWGISSQELRARALMIIHPPKAIIDVTNHVATISDNSLVLGGFGGTILEWTSRYQNLLPDMKFVINGLAEPRVILANDRIDRLVKTCAPKVEGPITGFRKELEVLDFGKKSSWQIGVRSCPEGSPSRSILLPDELTEIKFIKNATLAKDWCEHPEAVVSHGMFTSPYNLKITDTLVPFFSHGKPSTSQDILYPSPDYLLGYRSGSYNESIDNAWENKTNQLYWSGSDTGGYIRSHDWRHFHRQRFVDTVTNKENEIMLLARNASGQWDAHIELMGGLTDLTNVKFSSLDACRGQACDDQRKHLPVGDRDRPEKIHEYRFLFDVDGMGRTERYYRLLGSKSTILKQTMQQEWHDDRLIPWVHYVPVSLSMDELPEIMRFLMLTESGQKISQDIAYQGRDWQQKALREEDMSLAFLRILLEYGRLVSDDRDREGYCPRDRIRPDESH